MKKLLLSLGMLCALTFGKAQSIDYLPAAQALPGELSYKVVSSNTIGTMNPSQGNVYYCPGVREDYTHDLRKPIIFVEGIDFGKSTSHFGSENQLGSFGWPQFIGTDKLKYPMLNKSPELLKQLHERGYDIILIDFFDGADYMQNNAMLVVEVLQKIKALNPKYPATLVGNSMGGQVAKYALNYMEENGMPHCVTKYISFDSPHTGANISIGFQGAMDIMSSLGYSETLDVLENKMNRPATKQLLLTHATEGANIERQNWYNSPLVNVLPGETRNVAIANGSGIGVDQGLEDGQTIFQYDATLLGVPTTHHIYVYSAGVPVVTDVFLPYGGTENWLQKLAAAVAGNEPEYHSYQGINFDNVPGSYRETTLDFYKELPVELKSDADSLVTLAPQTFIPTYSALGLPYGYAYTNMNANKPSLPTPFEDFYAPTNNEPHVLITQGNMEWLLNELDKTEYEYEDIIVGNEINMFSSERRFLSDLIIGQDATLFINGDISNDYGEYPVDGSMAYAQTCDCETEVVVKADGRFQLGDVNGNKAEFRFTKGSTLTIEAGGLLQLHPNSKLILEAGAEIILEEGAAIENYGAEIIVEEGASYIQNKNVQITLEGTNAKMTFEGSFSLKPDASYAPIYTDVNGYTVFDTDMANIRIGEGASFRFEGQSQNHKVLDVKQSELIISNAAESFEVEKGKIELAANARLEVGAEVFDALLMKVYSSTLAYEEVLIKSNQVSVIGSTIVNGKKGLVINSINATGYHSLSTLTVYRCEEGVVINNCRVNLGTSSFYQNHIAVLVEGAEAIGRLSALNITNNTGIGVSVENSSACYLRTSEIINSNIGLSGEESRMYVSCSKISDNQIGIMISNNSYLDLRTAYGYGNNDLSLNGTTIQTFASRFYLYNGKNKLNNRPNSGVSIKGTVNFNSTNVYASGNQWTSSSLVFYNSFVDLRLSTTYQRVYLRDLSPRFYTGCTEVSRRDMETNVENGIETNNELSMYPNPSNGVVNIDFIQELPQKIEVYDLSGKLVKNMVNLDSQIQFNLTKGVYMVKVINEDFTFSVERLVVN